ncbi:MAG: ogr/Delta-like zinc finger family protein [Halothiobacillaceae bacterium]|nr:MAG: ogr/Delta-like zinc finger family protein [Halothiobacillaceae bacterium]
MKVTCPHCEKPTIVRTSEKITRQTRQAKLICTNADCGHTFIVVVEAVKTISPSATPHPEVRMQGPTLKHAVARPVSA